MNRYGRQAQRHWSRYLPGRYSAIQDPETFFTGLGGQAADRIDSLTTELAGDDPPGESYLDKAGRLNMAKLRAEEIVRAEILMPGPETDSPGASF